MDSYREAQCATETRDPPTIYSGTQWASQARLPTACGSPTLTGAYFDNEDNTTETTGHKPIRS